MTRRELIAKKRRQLRDGRALEAAWIRAGRPRGGIQHFHESARGRRKTSRRPFGRTAIEARAIFMQSYRNGSAGVARTALGAFRESYRRNTRRG